MSLPAPAVTAAERSSETRTLLRLSAPLVAGHAGSQLMSLVDAAMVGRLGKTALAAVGIGNGLFFALTIFGMGCVLGMDPLVAQALGAGEHARARRILREGMRVAFLIGVPVMGGVVLLPYILGPVGVDAETARLTRDFMWARGAGVLPFLLFSATRSYLQATSITRPFVIGMVIANVVNFVGNWLLIFVVGWGVVGSGLSSAVASLVLLFVTMRALPAVKPGDLDRQAGDALPLRIVQLGLPLGLQMLAEVGIFATVGVMAGRMSATAAASHQVALTLASLTFTVALGFASATTVLVGKAVGRGDTPAARRAGFLGLAVAALWMSVGAAAFLLIPGLLARGITSDTAVVAAAIPLLQIAALFQLSDGTQVVAAGALRGAGDTRTSMWANIIGYYVIALPIAVGLGFGLGWGAPGLWWGLSVGLTIVAAALTLRFRWLSARPIRRV